MKAFIHFTVTNTSHWDRNTKTMIPCEPYQTDLLGSDGVFVLDGRQKLHTWIRQAYKRIHALEQVHSNITGFKIMSGNFRNAKCIHTEIVKP
jgi:hypothetical protein